MTITSDLGRRHPELPDAVADARTSEKRRLRAMGITFKRTGKSINDDCMDALKAHGIPCQLDNCLRVIAKMPDGLWHLCECWRRSSECCDEFCIDIDQDKRFAIKL